MPSSERDAPAACDAPHDVGRVSAELERPDTSRSPAARCRSARAARARSRSRATSPGTYTDQNCPPTIPCRRRGRSVCPGVAPRAGRTRPRRAAPARSSRIAHGRSLCPSTSGTARSTRCARSRWASGAWRGPAAAGPVCASAGWDTSVARRAERATRRGRIGSSAEVAAADEPRAWRECTGRRGEAKGPGAELLAARPASWPASTTPGADKRRASRVERTTRDEPSPRGRHARRPTLDALSSVVRLGSPRAPDLAPMSRPTIPSTLDCINR